MQLAETVVRNMCAHTNLLWRVECDMRARLPAIIQWEAAALIPDMARGAIAEARPDPAEIQRVVEEKVRAGLTDLIRSEADRLIPEIATAAVAAATPDVTELRAELTRHTEKSAAEAVRGQTLKAIPDVVTTSAAEALKTIGEALRQEQDRVIGTIRSVVEREVDQLLEEFTPNVVRVVLPERGTVDLGTDSHAVLPDLLTALHARCHVLLVGPAGTGKSMLAKQAAQALGLDFQALSLGPTTPMSKVFGYFDAHGTYHGTPFRRAFEHGGVMLLDEIDNGHPGLLAELNQALALGTCAFADGMVSAHEDFRLVATGNTYGTGADRHYVGRQTLDAATLDRFVVVDVPIDEKLEERIALRHAPSHRDAVRDLLQLVRDLRTRAAEKQLPVMFSPRTSIDGAKLIEAGATAEQVLRWRVVRGLSPAHRSALELD
ncbi:AAA domain (dynein-related subfamily) [Allokutzneria albata]|uniref:AAA domain (Dynein-related subfamily) n=2 Tax=Allokutzneria albata TaxID=211114 RepID=A0A1G9Y0N0_ALLAB|nr:AAA domain (dynein-related subfamily) [Allokutzneria albata]